VDVLVEREIIDRNYFNEQGERVGFRIQPGWHHLDGSLALAYARSRKSEGENDFTRAARQQQILTAVREKLTAGNLVLALPALLDAVKNTISTDVPESKFSALAAAIQQADLDKLERVVLQPPDHMTADPLSAAGYILIPDIEAIRETVDALMDDRSPEPSPVASAGP
jgi:anionic cell wall polymer biosynthesis LytR-Cps2A-Psr (LCP) family protein